jgi:hypothetical protein
LRLRASVVGHALAGADDWLFFCVTHSNLKR